MTNTIHHAKIQALIPIFYNLRKKDRCVAVEVSLKANQQKLIPMIESVNALKKRTRSLQLSLLY